MSDFDKEAEREKLRERFEAEEEDREVTARMSELLLQGATMTNRHCDTCHSPIFTYQGQSFCPTCQVEVGGPDSETAEADATNGGRTPSEPAAAESGSTSQPATDGNSRSATRIEVDDPGNGADTRPSASPDTDVSPEPGSDPAPVSDSTTPASAGEPARRPSTTTDTSTHTAGEADRTGDTDLAAAQASLSRTLSRLSQQAEWSEDLSQTRDYLLAAQEAAEALTALKEARR